MICKILETNLVICYNAISLTVQNEVTVSDSIEGHRRDFLTSCSTTESLSALGMRSPFSPLHATDEFCLRQTEIPNLLFLILKR